MYITLFMSVSLLAYLTEKTFHNNWQYKRSIVFVLIAVAVATLLGATAQVPQINFNWGAKFQLMFGVVMIFATVASVNGANWAEFKVLVGKIKMMNRK